ncbi:adenosine deaminase [Paraglaciecola aquimarina]|uniref:Adenine deaminase n=2 Tax=Paraglaciecola algarum TaxID=3050085 RepID=A0ABS9DA79_9ALTE|nr:adenosine deaminase [Paraglaciecola sp. G1-23]
MPKAELHLHIDGAISPQMMFDLAEKNSVILPYKTVEEVEAAYEFSDLQSFLDLYYQGASVLQTEQDFYDLTWDYCLHCQADNILHTEISFDPQTHTERGIAFDTVISGTLRALKDAEQKFGLSYKLMLNFLRHLSEESAQQTLQSALPWAEQITSIGLDSSELDHPPRKFERVFAKARAEGFKIVAHAGEEGPPDYIWQAIQLLKVDRIDHGVRADEDPALVEYLIQHQIPLTVCPLSNVRLCVYENLQQHNIFKMLGQNIRVTVNSDDPTYFGGYLNDNFFALADAFPMTQLQAIQLAHNSFTASFISDQQKQFFLQKLISYVEQFNAKEK